MKEYVDSLCPNIRQNAHFEVEAVLILGITRLDKWFLPNLWALRDITYVFVLQKHSQGSFIHTKQPNTPHPPGTASSILGYSCLVNSTKGFHDLSAKSPQTFISWILIFRLCSTQQFYFFSFLLVIWEQSKLCFRFASNFLAPFV